MNYAEAKSEIFQIASDILAAQTTATPFDMRWPGVSKPGVTPPVNGFYGKAFLQTIRDGQASLAKENGISRYAALAQFLIQIYSPISLAGAIERGTMLAEGIRDAYRRPSPSGLLSFTNQLVRDIGNDDTHYITRVSVDCTYDNFQ